jgi:hypothetical protein
MGQAHPKDHQYDEIRVIYPHTSQFAVIHSHFSISVNNWIIGALMFK